MRAIRRKPFDERWSKVDLQAITAVPWDLKRQNVQEPLVRRPAEDRVGMGEALAALEPEVAALSIRGRGAEISDLRPEI